MKFITQISSTFFAWDEHICRFTNRQNKNEHRNFTKKYFVHLFNHFELKGKDKKTQTKYEIHETQNKPLRIVGNEGEDRDHSLSCEGLNGKDTVLSGHKSTRTSNVAPCPEPCHLYSKPGASNPSKNEPSPPPSDRPSRSWLQTPWASRSSQPRSSFEAPLGPDLPPAITGSRLRLRRTRNARSRRLPSTLVSTTICRRFASEVHRKLGSPASMTHLLPDHLSECYLRLHIQSPSSLTTERHESASQAAWQKAHHVQAPGTNTSTAQDPGNHRQVAR